MGPACLFLLFFLSLGLSTNGADEPGLKLLLTKKGVNYANDVARGELQKILETLKIADQHQNGDDLSWSLSNIQVSRVSKISTSISLNPDKKVLTLSVSGFSASVRTNYYARKKVWFFHITGRGGLEASVGGASVTVTVTLGIKNGRPSPLVHSCSASIPGVSLHFTGGFVSTILNLFKGKVQNLVRDTLQTMVCDLVKNAVDKDADKILSQMKVQSEVADKFIVDYSLVDSPQVTGEYIETRHKGEVSWKGKKDNMTFLPNPIPAWHDSNKMLNLFVTQYTAKTFAYVAHTNGYLQYNSTLPLGDIDPNLKAEISVVSSAVPEVRVNTAEVTVDLLANVLVFLQTPDNNRELVINLKARIILDIQPYIENDRLKGILSNHSLSLELVKSNLEDGNELVNTLTSGFQDLAKTKFIPLINENGKKGLELMLSEKIRFTNVQMTYLTGVLVACGDVNFQ